jgi:hypothetical protein
MHPSTLIDVIVVFLIVEFGFLKLLDWLYDGPNAFAIFVAFTATALLVAFRIIFGRSKDNKA